MKNRITIIGAGNGGVTAAYHLSALGREVCLYDAPEFDTQIRAIGAAGGVTALEELHGRPLLFPGFQPVARVTTSMEEAAAFSDTLVMICPSFAQEFMFSALLPYLREGHIVMAVPGNFASLVFKKMLDASPKKGLNITFADCISLPWATRLGGPAKVCIMGLKEFLPLSIFPKTNATPEVREKLQAALPIPAEFLDSPIQAGLENINFGGHPLLTTVNIGLLENFDGNFTYYRDCCSPSTARASAKMDLERLAVGQALGLPLRTELEAMNALYAADCKTVYDFNRGSPVHEKLKDAPNTAKARYITEDVPYLLVPIYLLARKLGVRADLMRSVICLASAYNDEDYLTTGRTLEKMGLDSLTPEELCAL